MQAPYKHDNSNLFFLCTGLFKITQNGIKSHIIAQIYTKIASKLHKTLQILHKTGREHTRCYKIFKKNKQYEIADDSRKSHTNSRNYSQSDEIAL